MRVVFGYVAACLAFGGLNVEEARAQIPSATTTDSAPACELHFWGSDVAMTSTYSGVSGMAGGLLAGPSPQSRSGLVSDLPPQAQAEALKTINLAALLKMPNVRLITEPETIDQKLVKRSGPRLSSSKVPCYAELVVDYIGYTSHITAGRKFGARFWLRRYTTDATALAEVQNGGKDVKIRAYPAKRPEDQAAAIAELNVAFGQVVEGFLLTKIR